MKKLLVLVFALLFASIVFGQNTAKLAVVYFHAEHRCPTCLSIEENTKKTLNTWFSEQLKAGAITLSVLDVSDSKNLKMVEKYQADGSGLFVTRMEGKKEKTTDLTNFAFSYSRNQPEKFISGLKAEIEKNLK